MNDLLAALPILASGLSVTLGLMMASLVIGLALGILITFGNRVENFLVRKSLALLVFFVRGTPLLVQIFLIYYGAGQFAAIRDSFIWPVLREPAYCAILALSINSACYTSVLFEGALHSIPHNEYAACEALGMSKWLAMRHILFPRAFRIALPAYSNEVIMILKGTSLASTITLLDLMGVTQQLIAETYQTVDFYLIAGFFYLVLNGLITLVFRLLLHWLAVPR